MGFMGYAVFASDGAADMASDIVGAMVERLEAELSMEHSCFNTSGALNVAMFIDEVMGHDLPMMYPEEIHGLAAKTADQLRKERQLMDADASGEVAPGTMLRNLQEGGNEAIEVRIQHERSLDELADTCKKRFEETIGRFRKMRDA